jgi:hypothetical protein
MNMEEEEESPEDLRESSSARKPRATLENKGKGGSSIKNNRQQYFQKCKATGRLGPLLTQLERLTVFGVNEITSMDDP